MISLKTPTYSKIKGLGIFGQKKSECDFLFVKLNGFRLNSQKSIANYSWSAIIKWSVITRNNQKDRWQSMKKLEMLYEGKAKKVYTTDVEDVYIVDYKDDATAFNGLKKGTISGKGVINNKMTNHIFKILEEAGIPTHLVEELSDRETAVKKVEIVPLEVIVRNVSAGSFAKKLGIEEGRRLLAPTLEFSYKNDELGDPMINDYYAIAIGAATREEIDRITELVFKINEVLVAYFAEHGIDLIDFKVEFGRYKGQIILADEISPDTCRLWDSATHDKLDKDRFRRDLGNVEDAYIEVANRLGIK